MNAKLHSMLAAVVMAAAVPCLSGCAYVYRSNLGAIDGIKVKSSTEEPVQAVYISTIGYYFLWTVPLASGDLRWNDEKRSIEGGTRLFCDMVSVDDLQNALLKLAEVNDCDVVDIVFYDHDTSYASASYAGLLGAFFGSSEIGVSGVLVAKPEAPAEKKGDL